MNSKPVFALSEVTSDLLLAAAHYQSWRLDGREHFLRKYDETISWIAWNPDLFPRKAGRIQRAIIKQSYFVVYYLQEPDRTLVLAVLDGRKSPGEIRGLLFGRRKRGADS